MEPRPTGSPAGSGSNQQSAGADPQGRSSRSVWVVTAYAISGLVLFGILAYYFSSYIAH